MCHFVKTCICCVCFNLLLKIMTGEDILYAILFKELHMALVRQKQKELHMALENIKEKIICVQILRKTQI